MHFTLHLKRDVKDSKSSFFKYTSGKRETRGKTLAAPEWGALVIEDTDKVDDFFPSVCTALMVWHWPNARRPWGVLSHPVAKPTQLLRPTLRNCTPGCQDLYSFDWRKDGFPFIEEDWVKDHLGNPETHRSMGPDGMCLWMLGELADVTVRSLAVAAEGPEVLFRVPRPSQTSRL